MRILYYLLIMFFLWQGCTTQQPSHDQLFTLLSANTTGIDFENKLEFDPDFNIYKYRNYYNGGGVALGDINNDGLQDVYMTANMKDNSLYLNKGNLKFEDITEKVGVKGTHKWSTGVTMADVNGDGWLDIYVCNSGDLQAKGMENELFINMGTSKGGIPVFKESAALYHLDDKGYGTHAAFFDYDKDGDLDCYVLNNAFTAIGGFNLKNNLREERDPLGGHKLMRNDGPPTPDGKGGFTDVSAAAGIYGSKIAFGLGVTVGDVNQDGWPDIYVSNDFFERDYLYVNLQNGRFEEVLEKSLSHCSAASMGADMADVNNDVLPDIFATDMLPQNERRIKTKTTFDSWNHYKFDLVDNGYHYQFTRNMLQVNNGDGTFSEQGCMEGVEATDWSWAALIADFDNDGWKDIYIANGLYQDLTDQDFIQYIDNDQTKRAIITEEGVDFKKLVEAIPSEPVSNYAYSNNGEIAGKPAGLTFTDKAKSWGLDQPGFSNGAAYGDLDNDGDLDLVVNNINMKAWVYRNNAESMNKENRWLRVVLQGDGKNPNALGTKLLAKSQGKTFYLEQMPTRGFQSSVDNRPFFGLGNIAVLDSLIVQWPDGRSHVITKVATNQELTLRQSEATLLDANFFHFGPENKTTVFRDVTQTAAINFRHRENPYSDFDVDRLTFQMLSTQGPKITVADVNRDGLDDFYICGARNQAGRLFLQEASGRCRYSPQKAFVTDSIYEDTNCLFFDIDQDGDQDLYVASGGSELNTPGTPAPSFNDRLYRNDGRGNFTRLMESLPGNKPAASSCVRAADYDKDGDLDIFVGIRSLPGAYGIPMSSFLLKNDGKGRFDLANQRDAPELKDIGMVTDATWSDYDNDGDPDIIIVGEYMPLTIFKNEKGKFKKTIPKGLEQSNGWWNVVREADVDHDGDKDYIMGNFGLNSRFRGDAAHPIEMWVHDFDKNEMVEQLVCQYNQTGTYPLVLRHDLISQLPPLKKKFVKYSDYAEKTIDQIFAPEQLTGATRLYAFTLASAIAINDGKGGFTLQPLPWQAQLAPTYAILYEDFDADGKEDLLLAGNMFEMKPEIGRADGSRGLLMSGDGKGNFTPRTSAVSGLYIEGAVRDMAILRSGKQRRVLVARNDMAVQVLY